MNQKESACTRALALVGRRHVALSQVRIDLLSIGEGGEADQVSPMIEANSNGSTRLPNNEPISLLSALPTISPMHSPRRRTLHTRTPKTPTALQSHLRSVSQDVTALCPLGLIGQCRFCALLSLQL